MTLPSQIVHIIREHYPQLADHTNLASAAEAAFVSGVLAAVRELPPTCVPADIKTRFATTVGALESGVRSCSPDARRGHLTGRQVRELSALLAQCPDEPFRPDDTSLQFIDDVPFRRALSVDIASAHRALANAEWKGATVLAGSVIEALCLWAIRRTSTDVAVETADRLQRDGLLSRKVHRDVLHWHAPELIEVAFALEFLDPDATHVARTTREYRNLIHPGREVRTGQQCTEGVAHVVIGAMQRVVECLQSRQLTHWSFRVQT